MPIGTIDFYHFKLLSLTVTLPGGAQGQHKQNLLVHFLPQFSSDQDEILCWDEAIWAENPETIFEYDLLKQGK